VFSTIHWADSRGSSTPRNLFKDLRNPKSNLEIFYCPSSFLIIFVYLYFSTFQWEINTKRK
jgi:hypothetical protein